MGVCDNMSVGMCVSDQQRIDSQIHNEIHHQFLTEYIYHNHTFSDHWMFIQIPASTCNLCLLYLKRLNTALNFIGRKVSLSVLNITCC